MQRQLVRLYDPVNKKMLYPAEAAKLGVFITVDGVPVQIRGNKLRMLATYNLMYFTGLKDNVGQLLWESDIVDFDILHDFDGVSLATKERGVMRWLDSGAWTFMIENGDFSEDMLLSNVKKIGNIHENPELVPKPQNGNG